MDYFQMDKNALAALSSRSPVPMQLVVRINFVAVPGCLEFGMNGLARLFSISGEATIDGLFSISGEATIDRRTEGKDMPEQNMDFSCDRQIIILRQTILLEIDKQISK